MGVDIALEDILKVVVVVVAVVAVAVVVASRRVQRTDCLGDSGK